MRLRLPLEPVADAAKRAATLFRQLGVVPLASEALLTLARLETEREHYDQALGLLEQAELWLLEAGSPAGERAEALRREIERQYVAVSLSTSNEFRALEDANRLFRETSDMDGLLAQTVKLAVENAGGDRGFVAFSSGGVRLDVVAQHGLGRDRARRILRALEEAVGPRLAESGPVFSSRVAADPRFGAAVADALESVASLVCVPLNFPSQSVGLVFVDRLNDNLLGPFKQRDVNLLAVLANSAAVAIVEAQRSLLLAENRELRDKLKPSAGMERVVTASREMKGLLALLSKVGDSSATVLFMGETGTGKGLLAQVVHESSNRRDRPFVQVNCAALPESLLESELFGYVHGAFTGAVRDKQGLFEEAEGGTIFLDEIEKVPESVQAKLLHVLDRGEIRPVGATRSKRVDARVICATGVDLRERIREGRFLEDLYYRLNDITVRVPALRERREDIPVLAQHFLSAVLAPDGEDRPRVQPRGDAAVPGPRVARQRARAGQDGEAHGRARGRGRPARARPAAARDARAGHAGRGGGRGQRGRGGPQPALERLGARAPRDLRGPGPAPLEQGEGGARARPELPDAARPDPQPRARAPPLVARALHADRTGASPTSPEPCPARSLVFPARPVARSIRRSIANHAIKHFHIEAHAAHALSREVAEPSKYLHDFRRAGPPRGPCRRDPTTRRLPLQGNALGESCEVVDCVLARRVLLVCPRRGGPPSRSGDTAG